ncbi:MAG: acetyltransferase [Pseudomonadota bacterium]|nr:MAG: acetyltransferase [Pseudomonadota bacterium]
MFLKDRNSGDLVEVLDTGALFDPCKVQLVGRFHAGEEMQDPETFSKASLMFPSDEALPRCWLDPNYKAG